MTNKKIIIITLVALLTVILAFFIKGSQETKISKIDQIISEYPSFTFENINYDINFTKMEYSIKYENNTNIKISVNNQVMLVSIVNGQIHFFYNDIDYVNKEISNVIKIMEYKSCNCNEECKYIVILTDSGEVYYINIYNNINNLENIVLNKLEIEDIILDIGFIENLDKIDTCGVNGIGLKTKTNTIIIDNEFKNFNQEYYKTIGSLYIYNDGTIKNINNVDLNKKIIIIFLSDNNYYFIEKDGLLYKADNELNIQKISEKKVLKVGYKDTKELIIILEDGTAKKFEIKDNLIIR